MTTRTYDYILTVSNPDVVFAGDSILSNTTNTSAEVVATDASNSNIKVKVANVHQEFITNENARPVFNIVTSDAISVNYSNSASTTVNGNSFIINGSTNTFSLPEAALSLANISTDTFSVFIDNRRLDKSLINFPSNTLGSTGFDVKPIPSVTTGVEHTKRSLRSNLSNQPPLLGSLVVQMYVNNVDAGEDETFTYDIDYNNWVTANVSSIAVRVDTGNTESIPFSASVFSEQLNGETLQITNIINSNYIRERNAFVQNPLVRLYTIYYPGEWYKPNEKYNPTNDGEGRRWPDGFPIRFAVVR